MLHTRIIVAIAAIFIASVSNAQISKISYLVKFNEKTNLFDCYLKVTQGNAKSARERAQFNAQYTLMVPAGSEVKMAGNHMPIQRNMDYKGEIATDWNISNKVLKPEVEPNYDFISITPSLSPAAFYNDLKEGDEVKLFSLKISPVKDCGANVMIFENNSRITSSSLGMDGGDFSNGFTMGDVSQKYAGNIYQEAPDAGILKNVVIEKKDNIKISAEITETPYAPVNFEWFGPSNLYSEKKDLQINNPDKNHEGMYKLIVTDSRGCQDIKEFEINNLENVKDVSLDQLSKAGETLEKISIYPNPASNHVALTVNGAKGEKLMVKLADANGRVVQDNVIDKILTGKEDVFDVSVQQLHSGIYNMILNIDGKEKSQRLIVIK